MVIAHPPCTYLTVSGNRWFKDNPKRLQQQKDAIDFVKSIWNAPAKRICIENPIGYLSTLFREPTQIIQPWQFGHGETKATCLWLKGLPLITPTYVVKGREAKVHKMPPSEHRWKERSRTYSGIAEAMGQQWGENPLVCYKR